MSGLKMPTQGEGIQDQVPDQGKGLFSELGGKFGRIPVLSKAIQAGAMLGILGGAASLEGCTTENGSVAVGSEKAGQRYGTMEAALTVDEMKALTTPKAVAGAQLWDSNAEIGDGKIGGKEVMFITRAMNPAGSEWHLFYKLDKNLKGLVDSGTFTEAKGMEGLFTDKDSFVRGVSMHKDKLYISMGYSKFSVAESDMVLNAQGEVELSNFKEVAQGMSDTGDIKVVEIDGVPYLYGASLSMQRKNLVTGVVEDLIPAGSKNYVGDAPAYHNGMWIGGRFVQSGGQTVERAYSASTAEGVATSSTPVLKLNQGIWANTGDVAIAEDDERVIVTVTKSNDGYPTSVLYSEYVKPVNPNPDPNPDGGSTEVDGGATEIADDSTVTDDIIPPPVDAADVADDTLVGPELPPPVDAGTTELPPADDIIPPPADAADVADDTLVGPELPPADDIIPPPADAADVADDTLVGPELPTPDSLPDDGSAELPQTDAMDGELPPPDAQTQSDTAVGPELPPADDIIPPPVDAADVADGELPPPDAKSEVSPADIAAEIAAEVANDTSLPQPDASQSDISVGQDASGSPDGSQNSDSPQGPDGLQQPDSSQKPDVGSNPPVAKDGCSAGPTKSPRGANALAAYILAAVIAVYSRRRTVKKL